ncbi:MAG: SUMF1/EgtB/PvdO family nonheme iron enzyme [Desulfobacula sp.]|nr:SUMF1/EgtB/PvdO family nonheme iron enzyme [Desulfobacula sp.]
MNSKVLLIVLLLAFLFNVPMVSASNRVALVLGNGAYATAPLKNPVNDARDMAAVLKESGFKVILKINASRREMKTAVRTFGKQLRQNGGIGLFYYAGHGLQLNNRNYLVSIGSVIESEGDVEFEAVDAGLILNKMEDAGNDLNIVILDACRNNPFARSFRSSKSGLVQMDAPKGSIIAYATSPGELAADGEGRNGIYTKHLIKNIRNPKLTIEQVFKNVRVAVVTETSNKQVPWESSSLMGTFYFDAEQNREVDNNESSFPAETQRIDKSSLFVNTMPGGAKIRVLNIKPKFFQGMDLVPGKYYIEASLQEYATSRQWVSIHSGEQKTLEIVLNPLQEKKIPVDSKIIQLNQKKIKKEPADLETLLAQAKLEQQTQERKLENEKKRKNELKDKIKLYEDLIKNYGDKYKDQAWQAICTDFPLLTAGVKPGDISALRKASSLYKAGDTWKDPVTGMEFVWVGAGCFQMGSSSGDADEKLIHEVCVEGFWMGKYEVTQRQWQRIMGSNPSNFKSGDDYPVEQVSWNDVKTFISLLNQRSGPSFSLPTEVQWEYAARSGGKDQDYAGRNNLDLVAWYSYNSGNKTHRVGTKAPNDLGIYDMSGNVWEWCEDVYDSNAYSKHSRNNPLITSGGSRRVDRGGGWFDNPRSLRCANRGGGDAGSTRSFLGFRLIRTD